MTGFRLDNGKTGFAKAWHTSTGYECTVPHPWNIGEDASRVVLFIRHIVGLDGLPYVETGLSGLDDAERSDAISDLKRCLNTANFKEVKHFSEVPQGQRAYIQQEAVAFDAVSMRVKTLEPNNIVEVADTMRNLMHGDALYFIKEQESNPEVLFESILGVMGADLDKGPGGHEHAVEVARRLAAEFQRGSAFTSAQVVGH